MLQRVSAPPLAPSISSTPACGMDAVPETGPNPGCGTDDWFYPVAVAVFGTKETGQLLHLATGWPRTSCYAFVARDPDQRRKPAPDFLRILFRSEHGRPFFLAFMDGSDAAWWRDHQRSIRLADVAARFADEINSL
jgi:hypothetical protein